MGSSELSSHLETSGVKQRKTELSVSLGICHLSAYCFFLQAFGAPIIVAHVNDKPHMYFGSDRFLLLSHLLGK